MRIYRKNTCITYEADTHKPTKKMLYDRCHEMIDLAIGALPSIEA